MVEDEGAGSVVARRWVSVTGHRGQEVPRSKVGPRSLVKKV